MILHFDVSHVRLLTDYMIFPLTPINFIPRIVYICCDLESNQNEVPKLQRAKHERIRVTFGRSMCQISESRGDHNGC